MAEFKSLLANNVGFHDNIETYMTIMILLLKCLIEQN